MPVHSGQRDVVAEHRGIMDAVIAREAARACDLMRQHLARTTDILSTMRAQADAVWS